VSRNDPAANIEAAYPLSPMQEGMLFHTLLAPHSGIYLMQNRYRLEGAIDARAFVSAWRHVVARHAMLRARFVWRNQKRPLQVVLKQVEIPFDVEDLRERDAGAQEAHIAGLLRAERERGFDLNAPPTHFRLLRLGERSYEFVHSFHHIVLDEWCTSLLMSDFVAFYEAERAGAPCRLPPARPYRDYVDWLATRDAAATEAFWRGYLTGFDTPTPLGIERRTPEEPGSVVDLAIRLDRATSAALLALAKRERLTLNTLFQGAWALLLASYSGEQEVVFGVTVAGRPAELPDVDAIVGLFINTLPLRVRVAGDQPLLPWLHALFAQNLTLREYEHTPLVEIQRFSPVERGRELFESLFVFENAPIDPALRAGKSFRVESVVDRVHTNYPVTIMGWPDDELGLKISFDAARVTTAEAERMLVHLGQLLTAIAARPHAKLGELTLLTPAERERALHTWNPRAEPAPFASFAARFRAQVARSPGAVAARADGASLTYDQLRRNANRVANALREQGVGVDDRVVLCAERGLELLTMIVAVLELGAAYVPVEPSYPSGRVARIVQQSGARVLLAREASCARLADALAPLEVRPALLAFERAAHPSYSELDPPDRTTADTLAYVIFTSGSTGMPKGAMVEQRGMLNNMLTKLPRLGLRAGDVIAQTASPCFDISVWQHLTALLFGGTVQILSDEVVREPARLLAEVVSRGVAVLEVVPAVLAGMLEALAEAPARPARLRWVLPTGEALPVQLARRWLRALPEIPLLNAYGPAECSDDVALHALREPPDLHERCVPIGRPVEGFSLYVLDPWLAPVPVGVAGELYVGGVGVGRGYLAQPALTAAAFVPDPFGQEGARLYRSGDLARRREDGVLEFVGRRDHQVKLRGLRIELGEIESILGAQADVAECAVIVREDRPGAAQLVAYVVPRPAARLEIDALRAALGQSLPAYMVPHAFVALGALPRNANGKIDRRALPAPTADGATGCVEPRDEHERALAEIWREVLGAERVGVTESFFALGGHSLQLTQVLARVRRVFGVEVSLRSLFEAPTVAEQARAILRERERAAGRGLPELQAQAAPGPGATDPLSFAQERLWFLAQLEPGAAAYNLAAAVELTGELDVASLGRAFQALLDRHDVLRARMVAPERAGESAGLLYDARVLALGGLSEDLSSVAAEQREPALRELLERIAAQPFALEEGPLVRTLLVRIDARSHVLALVVHHAISDGWSMGVLTRDLSELYAAEVEGRAPQLPVLSVRYADYARWQRALARAGELERQLAVWRARLGDGLPTLCLPTDYARPSERSYRGARHALAFSGEHAGALGALAQQHGVTLFTALFAAFQLWVARISGQRSFGVGTPIANRKHEALEPLVGFFANTLVLRADLRGEPSFAQLVARAREEVLAAQEHQDVPFERLVQALKPARDLAQTPLFQVMFSLQELGREPLPAPGALRVRPLEVDAKSAQFDLSLHVTRDETGLSGVIEYSTDLFAPTTIARWQRMFDELLAEVLAAPERAHDLAPWEARAAQAQARVPAPEQGPSAPALASAPELELALGEIWAAVLGRPRVDAGDNFFELGGDSILSLDVVARAKRSGLRIQARHMFQYQTLRELAAAAAREARHGAPDADAPLLGETPLLPIQRRFFARRLVNPAHWNQSLLVQCDEPLDGRALDLALRALVSHHDALRLRFAAAVDSGCASFAPDEDRALLERTDLSRAAPSELAAVLAQHASRWQASLDLAHGPLLRAVHFTMPAGMGERLLLIVHHLVVDGVSWRVLLADLEETYGQALRGEPVALPEKTASVRRWAEQLRAALERPAFVREAEIWLELPWQLTRPLPLDDEQGDRSEASMASYDVALSEPETRALLELCPKGYRMRSDEILLAGLALALTRHMGARAVAIEVEGHGREPLDGVEIDLSRSVGWLTSAYPVVLALPSQHRREALVSIKEQLRAIPRRGLAYGVLRELGDGPSAARLRALQTPRVAFNYLGQWDSVLGAEARFRLASESSGSEHDPRSELGYELEIDAAVHGKRLELSLRHSRARLFPATVERIAGLLLTALREIIAESAGAPALELTPSDFPDVSLTTSDLDAILEQVD
jgi:amino acid adenylation domain-containing protein/non-ribosomal peptide synthase protein (TIGR01720 family)